MCTVSLLRSRCAQRLIDDNQNYGHLVLSLGATQSVIRYAAHVLVWHYLNYSLEKQTSTNNHMIMKKKETTKYVNLAARALKAQIFTIHWLIVYLSVVFFLASFRKFAERFFVEQEPFVQRFI